MSGYISQETIDAVNNIDIISLVGEYTKLEPKGGSSYSGCCPFHNDKNPSFFVDSDKKLYHCFSCGVGGNLIKFVMEQEKMGFSESIEYLAKKYSITVKYDNKNDSINDEKDSVYKLAQQYIELYERTAGMFHYFLLESEKGAFALEYITKRGITMETIRKFKIGYSPVDRRFLKKFLLAKNFSNDFLNGSGLFTKKNNDCSFFSNRLMFPIFDKNGQVLAFGGRQLDNNPDSPKYLNSGDLIHYKKGNNLFAFNFAKKAIRQNKKAIICEGYMDCIAYHQCEIEYAVASLGTALTESQIKLLKPYVDEILLSFDSDGPGQKATINAILMLRKMNITTKVICIKDGKDPAEIMKNFGKVALTNIVSGAILDSDFLLSKIGAEYPIDTPEGKTRAAFAFFPYLDALNSDIQKVSCLEQMCQTFKLPLEAVSRDFKNRKIDNGLHNNVGQPNAIQGTENHKIEIKRTAELSSVLAVITDLSKFKIMHEQLSSNDFEDPVAKLLFSILEECFFQGTLSLPNIINSCTERCPDSSLSDLIINVISLGEFDNKNAEVIDDSIKNIKRKSLIRQRDKLQEQISSFVPITADDEKLLQQLLEKKVELNSMLSEKK